MSLNVKISQLFSGGPVQSQDELAISRSGVETYKIAASQFVVNGINLGSGSGQVFFNKQTGNGSTLAFRSLSGTDGLIIRNVGNTLVLSPSGQNPTKTTITADGVTREFPISGVVSRNANNYRVDIDGVLQEPTRDYIIQGNRIVFPIPPPIGGKIVVLSNNLIQAFDVVPFDGAVTPIKLSPGGISWTTSGNVGIKTTTPNTDLTVSGTISASNIVQASRLILNNLPTSPTGLPSGSVWRDILGNNALRIVP
jgi:hypothetical protein